MLQALNNIYFPIKKTSGGGSGLDTSDATATAEDIASGKTAYVNGEKIVGTLETDGFDTSLIRNTAFMFDGRTDITEALMFNTKNVTDMSYMFYGCTNLEKCGSYNTSKVSNFDSMFVNCTKLTDVGEMDFSKAKSISQIFMPCGKLANLGALRNLGQAYLKTSSASYAKYTLDLQYCYALTHDSLMNVINGLYDLTLGGIKTQNLVLGSTNLAKLTADEIAIATNKGWNVS